MTQQLRTASGKPISHRGLKEIGKGGEATVYELDARTVFKLYTHPVDPHRARTAPAHAKLELMAARPPATKDNQGNQVLAWPSELVYQEDIYGRHPQTIAGFLMPRVGGPGYRHIYTYWNPRARSQLRNVGQSSEETTRLLEAIAANLIQMMSGVHQQGYLMGDVNEQNILAAPTGLIAILDADSFQVTDPSTGRVYPCPVGRPEYTSPNYLRKMDTRCAGRHCDHRLEQGISMSYACLPRLPNDDRFSLAVMLFKLLMNGRHPFDGTPGQSYREKIITRQPAVTHHPTALPAQALERWQSIRQDWQKYLTETLEGSRYRPESEIPEAIKIFEAPATLGNQRTVQPPSPGATPAPSRKGNTTASQVKTKGGRPASPPPSGTRPQPGSRPTRGTTATAPAATGTTNCRVCGHVNGQNEVYCQRAGCQQELGFRKKQCRKCDKQIPHAAAYCRHCGAAAVHNI